jgi:cell division septal protein FtsQ
MTKRVGVNSRKKIAVQKKKVRGVAKKASLRIGIGIVITGVLAVAGIGGFKGVTFLLESIKESKAFSVTGIEVKGNSHVDTQYILNKCGFSTSGKTYTVKEHAVRMALLKNPWIDNVKVAKNLSGKIIISITERKPIALVNLKSVLYVDKYGVLFPIAKKVISEMPLLSGLHDTVDGLGIRRIKPAEMIRVKGFLSDAVSVNEYFLRSITQVNFSDCSKIRLSFQAYSTVVELDEANIKTNLRYLERLESVLLKDTLIPEKINLCYQNLAFVTTGASEQKTVLQDVVN